MTHAELSAESIAALRALIGRSIHTIFCPPLDAAGAQLAAQSLSFLLSKGEFVELRCLWSETPKYLNDSWEMAVSKSAHPRGIAVDDSGALLQPLSTIEMYAAKPIRRIQVFERLDLDEDDEAESVHYDQALVFHHGKRRFCIACSLNGPGLAEDLKFSEDETVIDGLIEDSSVRLTLGG